MMVRIEYEGGRTTLFDTLSFTEGSPFSGANMLTEFDLEMREEPEKGLWLTANWHQVRDDWRADAPADGIPAARRSRGWRFMLASEAELGRARRILLDGDEAFAQVMGYLLLASIYFSPFSPTYFRQSRQRGCAGFANADAPLSASRPPPPSRPHRRWIRPSGGTTVPLS